MWKYFFCIAFFIYPILFMYRFLLLFISILPLQSLVAGNYSKYQSAETSAYIQKYHKIAIKHMKKYRIPASITLAQGILESGSGRSALTVAANNHFGIKCKNEWKGKTYYKNDDKRHECFRKYDSAEESFEDHALFLAERKVYAPLFKYKVTDYKKWAKGLKKCGYATNPQYPSLLIDVIKANKLYLLDQNPDKYLNDDEEVVEDVRSNNPPKVVNGTVAGVKCVVVEKGNTLYGLAKAAGVSVNDLYDYNDFDKSHILSVGEVLYVGGKNDSYTSSQYHYVEAGESLWSISQKYAITLKSLQKMNSLKKNAVLKNGQRLVLYK